MSSITLSRQIKKVFDEHKRKGKIIMAMALTWTIKEVKEDLIEEMKKVFDNPTPFTLNSLYIVPATKDKLIAKVGIKDWTSKGNPASKYLSAQIEGGTRDPKRSEQLLRDKGALNKFYQPGKGLKLNKYGNIQKGKITQILSVLRAHTEVGFLANTTKQSKQRNKKLPDYFTIKEGSTSHLKAGVYQRVGKKIKPILIFTDGATYQKRFKFYDVAVKSFNKRLQANVNKATAKIYS